MEDLSSIEIFAFSGKMGSGKDFLARALSERLQRVSPAPSLFLSLADQLKVSVAAEAGDELARFYTRKDEASRRLLQQRGTEEARKEKGENVWVEYLLTWIRVHASRGISRFFVPDVRFPNEVEGLEAFARQAGCRLTFFRVVSPERTATRLREESGGDDRLLAAIASHPSETALDEMYGWPAMSFFLYNDPFEMGLEVVKNWPASFRAPR